MAATITSRPSQRLGAADSCHFKAVQKVAVIVAIAGMSLIIVLAAKKNSRVAKSAIKVAKPNHIFITREHIDKKLRQKTKVKKAILS